MRVTLIAFSIGIFGTLCWALLHQISKKESIPEKIKLYATSLPLHTELNDNDYELVVKHFIISTEHSFAQSNIHMHYKVDVLLRAIKENWGGIFVHVDNSAHYLLPKKKALLAALKNKDIIMQHADSQKNIFPTLIACRANKQTLQLWQTIKTMLNETPDLYNELDLNNVLLHNKIAKLRWDYVAMPLVQQENLVA